MTQTPRVLLLLLGLWAVSFLGSFVAFAVIEPTGSGFTRGTNRLGAFLGWQAAAIGFALVVWWRARQVPLSPPTRWVMRVPILIALSLFAGMAVMIVWGILAGQAPAI